MRDRTETRIVPRYFITATGTDQGKTMLTTLLGHQLRRMGKRPEIRKPVMSGDDGSPNTDAARILQSLGLALNDTTLAEISPWRFSAPLSPDLAAEREGKTIDWDALVTWCARPAAPQSDLVLIEGAGGLMSPLTRQQTNLDLIWALQSPVILVSASYLGCISHILTALEVLRYHAIPVHALVLSQVDPAALAMAEVMLSLKPQLPATLPVFTIAHQATMRDSWDDSLSTLIEIITHA